MKLIFYIWLVLATGLQSRSQDVLLNEEILRLRPTQSTVGQLAVDVKSQKLKAFSEPELQEYLKRHPVPVVLGINSQPYLIDHHHLSRALLDLGHKSLNVQIIGNWSNKTESDFWSEMEKSGYAYLYDAQGNKIKPAELPKSIAEMSDDPYRSLAYLTREAGAFKKSSIPFSEFFWAFYYKKLIKPEDLKNWERATEIAK